MRQLTLANIQFWVDIDCIISQVWIIAAISSGKLLLAVFKDTGEGTAAVLTQAMLNCSKQMGTSKTRMGFYKSNSL